MKRPDLLSHPPSADETADEQAMAWVMRLASGKATVADAKAIRRWRDASDANRRAFADVNLLWDTLGQAADVFTESRQRAGNVVALDQRLMNRRAALGGALAASAAAASYLALHPPLGLWPSARELKASFRTGTGEHREILLGETITATLNTRTSIAQQVTSGDTDHVTLVSGEAIFTARASKRQLVVSAGEGLAATYDGEFQIRNLGSAICVTCLAGHIRVKHAQALITLQARQQVSYDDRRMSGVTSTDPAVTTAWQRGLLIFDNVALGDVVEELDRYRAGKIMLLNEEQAQRPVVATFRTDQLDLAVDHLSQAFGLNQRSLPGGITVLS